MALVVAWLDSLRRLLATGGLALWLEMCMSVWRSLRRIGCLWSAFQAFLATPLVHALINVGGRMLLLFDVVSGPFGDNAHPN